MNSAILIIGVGRGRGGRSAAPLLNMGAKHGGKGGKRDRVDGRALGTSAGPMSEGWRDGRRRRRLSPDECGDGHVRRRLRVVNMPMPRFWAELQSAGPVARRGRVDLWARTGEKEEKNTGG